jgi:putative transposase
VVANRDQFGLEPICRVLQVAASAVRACLARPITIRDLADEALKPKIRQLFDDNYQVYGRRKIKAGLKREYGLIVDHDRVARLMKQLGIQGVRRGRPVFTTRQDPAATRAPDLVKRQFTATAPNQLWVSDFTYGVVVNVAPLQRQQFALAHSGARQNQDRVGEFGITFSASELAHGLAAQLPTYNP